MLRKTSLIDYPGIISAVVFFSGCNLRCPWCHNRELVLQTADCISLEAALAQIEKRKSVLGGVVLSGGEPTLFPDLGELISRIKSFGLKTKLDTNGFLPLALEKIFETEETRPDYIAMDIKTAPERYGELLPGKVQTKNPGESLIRSVSLVRASGIAHEFRSLELPPPPDKNIKPFFADNDRAALALLVGNSLWTIRTFVPGNCIDPDWNNTE